jgi:hypothetical protein
MKRKTHYEFVDYMALLKKHDVRLNGHHISILKSNSPFAKHDLGNKSWGKIDFLVNHCGYSREFVYKF